MNLLIVLHNSDYYSGATHSMIDIIKYWNQSKDINMTVLLPEKGNIEEHLKSIGVEFYIVKFYLMRKDIKSKKFIKEYLKGTVKKYATIFNIIPLIKTIKKRKIDYIYTNTSSIYIGYYLSRLLKIKHVWHVREFGREDQERISYDGEKKLYKRMNKSYKIIAISDAVKKYLIDKGVNSNRIQVVYNDVLYKPQKKANISFGESKEYIALSCGAIIKNKGHLTAINGVKMVAEQGVKIKLYIAGDLNTDYATELKEYVKENGLDNIVQFCGFIKDMEELRSRCNIAIIGSYAEAFGRITIEAMLSELIVIGSNSYGTADLIKDGYNGFLFNAGDASMLCAKIMTSLQDKSRTIRIIQNGRSFSEEYCGHKAALTLLNFLSMDLMERAD